MRWATVRCPKIMFVTAFDHFAVKAFAASVVDYLLKPVERRRLLEALERARMRRELRDARARVAELREIIDNLRADVAAPVTARTKPSCGSAKAMRACASRWK